METGGIERMQLVYAADLWRWFGISYVDQDQLGWLEFEWMCMSVDRTQEG